MKKWKVSIRLTARPVPGAKPNLLLGKYIELRESGQLLDQAQAQGSKPAAPARPVADLAGS
eukprot:8748408-Pyramimonas_sp.AAC.2